jgi:hypothetical protein
VQGVKVERILPGGRLAEIAVEGKSNGEGLMIMASNVATFSVDACAWIKSNETMSISVGLRTCTFTLKPPMRVDKEQRNHVDFGGAQNLHLHLETPNFHESKSDHL